MNYNIDLIISDYNLRRKLYPTMFEVLPHEIAECFEFYIDGLISARKSPNTIASYYFDIKVFLIFLKERYPSINSLSDLSVENIIHILKQKREIATIQYRGKKLS